jgi:formylglycine-generating enzyme required for sulfatase activity
MRRSAARFALVALAALLVAQTPPRDGHCPEGSTLIQGTFCIDRYEATLVEVLRRGRTRPWSPFVSPQHGHTYRAVSRAGVRPQGYISQNQARSACEHAGKRLCTESEWVTACRGPSPTTWPYGDQYISGRCNDARENPVPRIFPGSADVFHERQMNDPRLNQLPRGLARTGEFRRCTNRFGVHDMVGNLHEWVDAHYGSLGVFRGGFYADARRNGNGCNYATRAHSPNYTDYSTGFRCCADP